MKKILTLAMLILMSLFMVACDTEEIPAGHQGFKFDRTGAFAMYSGGDGLQKDKVLTSGTHFMGIYDSIRGVNCQDAHTRESLSVLTQSDMEVVVDLRITYSADCSSRDSLELLITQVQPPEESLFVQPEAVFERYVMPVIRESLRNNLADNTLEEVKTVRGELSQSIRDDLDRKITEQNFPVDIELLTVSSITLPPSITEKINEIELARMDVHQENERRRASEVRLERELFEAEQQLLVDTESARREQQIARIQADAELDVQKRHAEGIQAIRSQLTPTYLEYLHLHKDADVQMAIADSLGEGTVFYLGQDFLVPPNTNANVSVSR